MPEGRKMNVREDCPIKFVTFNQLEAPAHASRLSFLKFCKMTHVKVFSPKMPQFFIIEAVVPRTYDFNSFLYHVCKE